MSYNSDPTVSTLASALAQSADLQLKAKTRIFEEAARQFNALDQFTSKISPKAMRGRGIGSVFAERTDLRAGAGQTVTINVMGMPGGPGVQGATELTGNTSDFLMNTYDLTVDWDRDGVEITKDMKFHLSAGGSLEPELINRIGHKMGLKKQNKVLKKLILGANTTYGGNVYRPNNRATTADLIATDTLSLDLTIDARARLNLMGAKPLMQDMSKTGCPISKYLIFASETAMLPIRNDSSFQTAISQGDNRGAGNANFTGEILNWQGNPFYEFPVTNQDWDDFQGGPLLARASLGTAFNYNSAADACKLIVNSANTKSLYFQWFDGYEYVFGRETPADLSGNEYYAWIVNPDGSVGFVAYDGGFNGNQILVTKILTKNGAGTSTKGATTVGQLTVDTSATPDAWTGGVSTLPVTGPNGAWTYTDTFVSGAMIFQANAKGVPYTRSFALGAMSAVLGHGMIEMAMIKEKRDWGFVEGYGYEMIFGTNVCKNARGLPSNYLLIEHAIEHQGFPLPSYDAP